MTDPLLAGLLTGLTLIVAIGAQNAYVLRQGLAREHVGVVVAVCALSDLVLIAAGVAGIGTIVERAPWALTVVRWLGVAFLTWYAVSSLRRARRPESLHAAGARSSSRRGAARAGRGADLAEPPRLPRHRAAARVGGQPRGRHGALVVRGSGRAWRACCGSAAWATAPGWRSGILARPRAWQVLDVAIGLLMLAIAARLALG